MKVGLREWDFDVVVVEGVVDSFVGFADESHFFLYEHPHHHHEVDARVAKSRESHAHRSAFFHQVGLLFASGVDDLVDAVDEQFAHLLHVGAISHADRYLHHFVFVVTGEVLEVFAEQLRVEEGNHATVAGDNLSALIGD